MIDNERYWPGQMIYIGKAEAEDADYHYNKWDLDLDGDD